MFEDGNSYEEIVERSLARVDTNVDKREGSVVFNGVAPASDEIALIYTLLDSVYENGFADTAEREYLIQRCKERGIIPYPATYAVLKAEFNMEIPIGNRFNLDDLNYIITEFIGVTEDEDSKLWSYQLQCETLGTEGNSHFGELSAIDFVDSNMQGSITELLIPAEDEEDTEELRARYMDSFNETPFGGNQADYKKKCKEIDGVGGVKVTPVWNGDLEPASFIPGNAVKVWYASIINTLSDEVRSWLTAIYEAAVNKLFTTGGTVRLTIINSDYNVASDVLINKVQNIIDPDDKTGNGVGVSPIGHVVTVKSCSKVILNIKTKATLDDGYIWENIKPIAEEAIEEYLLSLRKNWADNDSTIVRISQIENKILNIDGVLDVQDTSINNSITNLVLGIYEIPVLGGVDNATG